MSVKTPAQYASKPRGLALVEVVVSTLVVSLLLAASLQAVAGARVRQWRTVDRARGLGLATALMNEILSQMYVDAVSPVFGLESGESLGQSRVGYDDVDDYHNLNETTPRGRDGKALADLTGWQRSVAVAWVSPANLDQVVGTDQGVKRVTVTVKHNSVPAATLVAYRTSAWPAAQER